MKKYGFMYEKLKSGFGQFAKCPRTLENFWQPYYACNNYFLLLQTRRDPVQAARGGRALRRVRRHGHQAQARAHLQPQARPHLQREAREGPQDVLRQWKTHPVNGIKKSLFIGRANAAPLWHVGRHNAAFA